MDDTYRVIVHTGRYRGEGTDANIQLTIHGTDGQSGPHKLGRFLRDDFEPGSADDFELECDSVGDLMFIQLVNDGTLFGPNWFVRHVEVFRGEVRWFFPHHNWIRAGEFAYIYDGRARLPQKETRAVVRRARATELDMRRSRYVWACPEGLPGHLMPASDGELPFNERFRWGKAKDFKRALDAALLKVSIGVITTPALVWNALTDVKGLFKLMSPPALVDRWRNDEEFGRQALMGVSPDHIRRIDRIPKNFPVTEESVRRLLDEGETLESELAAKQVYLLDFAILDGIPMFDDGEVRRYCPAAMCLLHVDGRGRLMPLAIQLGQDPAVAPIFTPADSEADWLMAKIYLKCAEGNAHQIVSHAVGTHFVIEPFVMAIMRHFSSAHPIYKLMRRHLRDTLAINSEARGELIREGGVFDKIVATGGPERGYLHLAAAAYAQWTVDTMSFPDELVRRGVDDPEALPNYPYRDDGLLLWDAMAVYVRETIGLYYLTRDDLLEDEELQDFVRDLSESGLTGGRVPFDGGISDADDLARMLTMVIFTSSVTHAALNYQQYEHYAYVPNCPLTMRRPPPTEKGVIADDDFAEMLPSRKQCVVQVGVGMLLSSYAKREQYLLSRDVREDRYFSEDEANGVFEKFLDRLEEIETIINERNKQREFPYDYLLPSKLPCSIAL